MTDEERRKAIQRTQVIVGEHLRAFSKILAVELGLRTTGPIGTDPVVRFAAEMYADVWLDEATKIAGGWE